MINLYTVKLNNEIPTNVYKVKYMEVKKTSINLPMPMSKKLKLLAIAKNTNQSELMKKYIKEGIERDEEVLKDLID